MSEVRYTPRTHYARLVGMTEEKLVGMTNKPLSYRSKCDSTNGVYLNEMGRKKQGNVDNPKVYCLVFLSIFNFYTF